MTNQQDPRLAGIIEFSSNRKRDSREKLLAAGLALLCENGYPEVSIEDVAAAAGLNRLTFYRHFSNKADLAVELYRQLTVAAMPKFVRIRDQDYLDRHVVVAWIRTLFEADRAERHLQQAFASAIANSPALGEPARQTIRDIISGLGDKINAFALNPDSLQDRRRWLEAALVIFEILDQSSHAARDLGFAGDPLIIDILADRFLAFVNPV